MIIKLFAPPLLIAALFIVPARAAEPVQGGAPAASDSQSQDDRIKKLIEQLTDEKFTVRDAATQELMKIGKAALPALKEALKSDDPNLKSYAEYLIPRIENPRRTPDASDRFNNFRGLNARGFNNRGLGGNIIVIPGAQQRSVTMSIANGIRRIDANEDGLHVVIDEGRDGIKMSVTESKDGKQITSDYSAKSADELMKEHPDAWKYYQKYATIGVPAIRNRVVVPPLRLDPFDLNALDQNLRTRELQMRQQLQDALRRSGIPEEQLQRMLDDLDRANRIRTGQEDR